MTTTAGGLKVIIAKAECQLERQRRVKPQLAARLKAGGRVDSARLAWIRTCARGTSPACVSMGVPR